MWPGQALLGRVGFGAVRQGLEDWRDSVVRGMVMHGNAGFGKTRAIAMTGKGRAGSDLAGLGKVRLGLRVGSGMVLHGLERSG